MLNNMFFYYKASHISFLSNIHKQLILQLEPLVKVIYDLLNILHKYIALIPQNYKYINIIIMIQGKRLLLFGMLLFISLTKNYYDIDKKIAESGELWDFIVSKPHLVVSRNVTLPDGINILDSNNCLSLNMFGGRLFLGWRSAPTHFASKKTKIFIMSSDDMGKTWIKENEIFLKSDMREPYFLEINGRFFFYFFQAGTNPAAFQPNTLYRIQYQGNGKWTSPVSWGQSGQIAWQYQTQNNTAYLMSYIGDHYGLKFPSIKVYFNKSSDGIKWQPVDPVNPVIYTGGISQIGWMFDLNGIVYGVGRNEDGDNSGWGRRIMTNKNKTFQFFSSLSDPNIIQSPRMFRHGNDLYLIGRTDPTGTFEIDNKLQDNMPRYLHHYLNLGQYSLRPHGNAIWRVLKETGKLWKLLDLPGCGDTSFPSILRIDDHTYWLANYSSPFEQCADWSWIKGQTSKQGTQIYILQIKFI